ncbi:hypothetical protein [Nocardioides sp. B-3]|uniref:hypothetical protein n=1 Tax=Nocardioides sp. B-3 TaxID=2895565 RepID=UPI0021530783|nr:hypothetical protein [Nocardioides sp. B-3]UUZ58968.1 hypothetical protein LP418_23540 [Nocardioides sp. B-3]
MTVHARPDDVDEICAALPSTEFGTTWGDVPTRKVPAGEKGRGFLLYRHPHKSAIDPESGLPYDDLLVIRTASPADKAALVEDESTPFFTIDHFRNFNAVLVQQSRLGELTLDELTEVVQTPGLAVAPKRPAKELLPDGE